MQISFCDYKEIEERYIKSKMAPLGCLTSFKVVLFDLLSKDVLKAKRIVTALDFERETCGSEI